MTRVSVATVLGCVVATISLLGQQHATLQPDQIFYNGKIVTVDPGNSIHEAFAVKSDRFLAIGTSAAIRAMASPQTVMVDLNGLYSRSRLDRQPCSPVAQRFPKSAGDRRHRHHVALRAGRADSKRCRESAWESNCLRHRQLD